MARKTKQYTRGGHAYELFQLDGMTAAELSVTVLNVAAGMLPLIVSGKTLLDLDVSKVRLDWTQIRPLIDAFAAHGYLTKQGKVLLSEVFGEHFAGDLDGIVELLLQGLELNYASFLERRLGLKLNDVAKLWSKTSAPSASESQTESTGTSGE